MPTDPRRYATGKEGLKVGNLDHGRVQPRKGGGRADRPTVIQHDDGASHRERR